MKPQSNPTFLTVNDTAGNLRKIVKTPSPPQFNRFGNVSPGFDNKSDDDATVKVNGYDLPSQNVNTRRIIGDDFIQDTRSFILTRYAMLSFTYKINNMKGNSN